MTKRGPEHLRAPSYEEFKVAVKPSPSVYEAAPIPYLLLDSTGVVRRANGAASRELHVADSELLGCSFAAFVADGSRELFCEHLASVLRSKEVERCDIELRCGDGATRWVRVYSDTAPPSLSAEEGVFCSVHDVDDLLRFTVAGSSSESAATELPIGGCETRCAALPSDENEPQWDAAYGALPGEDEDIAASSSPHTDTDTHTQAPAPASAEHPPRVLVVDDEELILSSTARVLKRCGYEVVVYSRSEDALQRFEAEPDAFDAVITDYRMQGMNGIELSERMISVRPGLPILIVSGYTDEIDLERVDAIGIREVLAKPVATSQFTASLERLVPLHRSARAS
jgi:PAS domain S-box-containing protein